MVHVVCQSKQALRETAKQKQAERQSKADPGKVQIKLDRQLGVACRGLEAGWAALMLLLPFAFDKRA